LVSHHLVHGGSSNITVDFCHGYSLTEHFVGLPAMQIQFLRDISKKIKKYQLNERLKNKENIAVIPKIASLN